MADLPMLHLILCDQEGVNDGLCHPRVHPGHPHVSLTTITRGEGWGGGGGRMKGVWCGEVHWPTSGSSGR